MSKNINIRHIYETRKLKKKGHTHFFLHMKYFYIKIFICKKNVYLKILISIDGKNIRKKKG